MDIWVMNVGLFVKR